MLIAIATIVNCKNSVHTKQQPFCSKNSCDPKILESNSNQLFMLGDDSFIFPNNTEKMNKRCKLVVFFLFILCTLFIYLIYNKQINGFLYIYIYRDIKPLEDCIKDYQNRCLDGYTKNSISVIIYGVSKTNRFYCSNKVRKNSFASFGNCANTNRKELNKVFQQLNRNFYASSTYSNPKLRIPLACW